MGKDRLVKT